MTATLSPEWTCEVCEDEPAVTAAAVPGVPVTVAYGERCIAAHAHPWGVLVANTAALGGLDNATLWWCEMVERTCAHLGRSLAEFNADVEAARTA